MNFNWTIGLLFLSLSLAQAKGPTPCEQPMDSRIFARLLSELSLETYSRDAKVRQFTDENCLESSQIRQLATLYATDQERLSYAYFAYSTVMDIQNYDMLETVFLTPEASDRFRQFLNDNRQAPSGWQNGQGGNWNNTPPPPPPPEVYVADYTGRIGCPVPMTDGEFNQAFQTLKNESFDNTRLQLGQQILGNRCATAGQIRELAALFSFETQRLEFAKFALGSVYDIDNYHIVGDVFDFDSNVRDLSTFVVQNSGQFVSGVAGAPPAMGNRPPPQGAGGWRPPAPSHNPNDFAQGGRPVPPPPPAPDFMPGYTGRVGCPHPMTEGEFQNLLRTLNNQNFDNTRLQIAQQAVANKCITAEQVKAITAGFSFESRRLEFAKFAYDSTYDIDNYFMVGDALDFDNSKRELSEFVTGR